MFWTQDTGKLRIGTYTGDLQHGTVYSGGEILNTWLCIWIFSFRGFEAVEFLITFTVIKPGERMLPGLEILVGICHLSKMGNYYNLS